MSGPKSWVSQISLYIPSLPFDLVSFFWVIYKRQVKLWCWASSRRKTIVNRNKVIEHVQSFCFCRLLFVLCYLSWIVSFIGFVLIWWWIIHIGFFVWSGFMYRTPSSGLWSFVEDCSTLSEVLYFTVLLDCCYEQWVFTKKYLSSLVFL